MNAIRTDRLSKNLRIKNISFELPQGTVMGLIGENGAGKSTLIKIITGMAKADSGTVEILGCSDKNDMVNIRQKIGVVMDSPCFPQFLNALNINKVMSGIYKEWDEDKFLGYVDRFYINKKLKFEKYSKGMKTKLAIAAALSHGARILIMDEATAGLDPATRDEVLDIINDFTRDERNSVLISSHILSDIEKSCDYITCISDGELIFSDDKESIAERYVKVHCGKDEKIYIDPSVIIGKKPDAYGINILLKKEDVLPDMETEQATLEDIMILMRGRKG